MIQKPQAVVGSHLIEIARLAFRRTDLPRPLERYQLWIERRTVEDKGNTTTIYELFAKDHKKIVVTPLHEPPTVMCSAGREFTRQEWEHIVSSASART